MGKGSIESRTTVNQFDIANAFTLCDMHGDVLEWCADYWDSNYEGAPTDGSAWLTDNKGYKSCLRRGGSWYYNPRFCRAATRSYHRPDVRS